MKIHPVGAELFHEDGQTGRLNTEWFIWWHCQWQSLGPEWIGKHVKRSGRGLTKGTVWEGLRKAISSGYRDLPATLPSAARRHKHTVLIFTAFENSDLISVEFVWGPYKVVAGCAKTRQCNWVDCFAFTLPPQHTHTSNLIDIHSKVSEEKHAFPLLAFALCKKHNNQSIPTQEGKNYSLPLWCRRWPWRYWWLSKLHRCSVTLLKLLNCKHCCWRRQEWGIRAFWATELANSIFHIDPL